MQKINKLNQYLLEKYPTVWNTKIVWMLLAALFFHIIFFVIGYLSHIDPVSLQKFSVRDDYFKNGVIFIHLIISILLVVGWILMMFKNNAFKNFYPSSKGKLFSQFVQYFIIIFSCTTFYFSYMTGFRMFINNKYPDSEMVKNVDIINRAAPFLSQNIESYTLENRLVPKPFSDLYCENDIEKIDRSKKFFVYYNRVYQYNSLYSKKSYQKDKRGNFLEPNPEYSKKIEPAYSEIDDSEKFQTFYYKKDVVDLSAYIKTTQPSFYNYSEIFYHYQLNGFDDGIGASESSYYYDKNAPDYTIKNQKAFINKTTTELLNRGNSAELEKLFNDFLSISKQYRIKNNLDAKKWTSLIFSKNNPNFEVRYFIKDYEPSSRFENDNYYASTVAVDSVAASVDGVYVEDSVKIREFNPQFNSQIAPDTFVKNNMTNYYYVSESMKDLVRNVDSMKQDDFFSENVHIYIWIAFFLSTFIFSFRITGLHSLLFTVISAGVLALFVTLITVFYGLAFRGQEEFFVSYFVLFIGLIILLIPLLKMDMVNKTVSSILVNISINGFVLFILLIFAIISIHQRAACVGVVTVIDEYNPYHDCKSIFEYLGFYISYIILISGFVFMYFYTSILQKWKAMPE